MIVAAPSRGLRLFVVVCLLSGAARLPAQTTSSLVLGPGVGDWFDAGNRTDGVPNGTDDAAVLAGTLSVLPIDVRLTGPVTLGDIALGNAFRGDVNLFGNTTLTFDRSDNSASTIGFLDERNASPVTIEQVIEVANPNRLAITRRSSPS